VRSRRQSVGVGTDQRHVKLDQFNLCDHVVQGGEPCVERGPTAGQSLNGAHSSQLKIWQDARMSEEAGSLRILLCDRPVNRVHNQPAPALELSGPGIVEIVGFKPAGLEAHCTGCIFLRSKLSPGTNLQRTAASKNLHVLEATLGKSLELLWRGVEETCILAQLRDPRFVPPVGFALQSCMQTGKRRNMAKIADVQVIQQEGRF